MTEEAPEAPAPAPCPHVQVMSPYDAVSSLDAIKALPEGTVPLKLDWNESTIPPSPRVIEAIQAFLRNTHHLNWYPDLGATRLRGALSRYTGVPADGIIVTNGSDDALDLLCRTFLGASDDAVVVWPTYGHFLIFARARGVEPRPVAPADPFDVPAAALLDAIRPDTKLVYIASPNNPTGVVTPAGDVGRLCRAHPRTLFVLDEAYHEFCGTSAAPLVPATPNLVVTRTFSKCFGIAGLRVGYLLGAPAVLGHLSKLYNPKSVNVLGQVGAFAALADRETREGYVKDVREGQAALAEYLERRGAEVRTTQANFLLVRVPRPKRFTSALESAGVFVRDRSHLKGFDGWVRITAGTAEQMRDLARRMDALLAAEPDLLGWPPSGSDREGERAGARGGGTGSGSGSGTG